MALVSCVLAVALLAAVAPGHADGGPCLVETVYVLWSCTDDAGIDLTVARVNIRDNPSPTHPTFIHCGPSGEVTTIEQDGETVLSELVVDMVRQPNKMTVLTAGSKVMIFENQPLGSSSFRGQLVQPLQAHLVCTPQGFPL